MKRILSLLLCFVLFFSLFSCGKEKTETIAITKSNYSDYLSIDVYITDLSIEDVTDTTSILPSSYSNVSFVVHIETSAKRNEYAFSDVVASYVADFGNVNLNRNLKFTAPKNIEIGYDGTSHCSFIVTGKISQNLKKEIKAPEVTTLSLLNGSSSQNSGLLGNSFKISGNVTIPVE